MTDRWTKSQGCKVHILLYSQTQNTVCIDAEISYAIYIGL